MGLGDAWSLMEPQHGGEGRPFVKVFCSKSVVKMEEDPKMGPIRAEMSVTL
jgi:hypothetical protein